MLPVPTGLPYQNGQFTVIFDARFYSPPPQEKTKKNRFPFRSLGFFCLGLTFLSLLFLFEPIIFSELTFRFFSPPKKHLKSIPPLTLQATFGQLLEKKDLEKLAPADLGFALIIPKLGLNTKVFANVDPGEEKRYLPQLKMGVAHAKGSYLPKEQGTVYLFAHSTDTVFNLKNFNALFYNLWQLGPGDEVNLVFEDKLYRYKVSEKKIVGEREIESLNKDFSQKKLILQTCWPPGTTFKRLLVFAVPQD